MDHTHGVEKLISDFNELSKSPELFTEAQHDISENFKNMLQETYSLAVRSNTATKLKTKSLAKLITDGFDFEQIWQQIEIQNKSTLPHFARLIPAMKPTEISFSLRRKSDQQLEPPLKDGSEDDDSKYDDKYAFDDDSDSSDEIIKSAQNRVFQKPHSSDEEQYEFDDDESDSDLGDRDDLVEPLMKMRTPAYKSIVDDQFFKLSELEEFLKIEDLIEEKNLDSFIENDEDDIDMFQDIPSDDVDDDELDGGQFKRSGKEIMYGDFFDAPHLGNECDPDQDADSFDKRVHFRLPPIADEGMHFYEDDDHDSKQGQRDSKSKDLESSQPSEASSLKTAFEIEQEKIRKKIQECEENMLQPMPWHLTGEVAASSRPINSLVDQETDFDSNAKQEIIIDNELTERVESIIKMAIINKAFCDVERKVKPTDEVIAHKKESALDQVKSKKSLAQVYEEDYLKKQSKEAVEEENPKHTEIKKLMDSLLPELHALFSHIPKPAIPEIKVVSNLPAVTVEEVAPTSVSDATLLAPEEVKKKSGLVKGKTERTDTDRKRERRKKKIHQRLKEKKKQEKLAKADPNVKLTKLQKLDVIKKLKQNRNTKIANIDIGSKIKSSRDFFSRLQDTVDSKASKKKTGKGKKE